jgi:hypothetical protein
MGKERFSFRITKYGKLFVNWHGEQGKREIVLEGARAEKLIRDLPAMALKQRQLAFVRATDNFKRGKERPVG